MSNGNDLPLDEARLLDFWNSLIQDSKPDQSIIPYTGAGFSKSDFEAFPVFDEIFSDIERIYQENFNRPTDQVFPSNSSEKRNLNLLDYMEAVKGRTWLIEKFSKTNSGKKLFKLPEEWEGEWILRTILDSPDGNYYKKKLHPFSSNVFLVRLLLEGTFPAVITTNWDTLHETFAELMGYRIQTPRELRDDDRNDLSIFVIENREEYYLPLLSTRKIYKINGGAFSVRKKILDFIRRDRSLTDDQLHQLDLFARRSWLVSTTDISSWRGEEWVEDLVKVLLRENKVVFLGASGQDVVTYVTVKNILQEELKVLDRMHKRYKVLNHNSNANDLSKSFFAFGYSWKASGRLINMLSYPYSKFLIEQEGVYRPINYGSRHVPNILFQHPGRNWRLYWRSGLRSFMEYLYARVYLSQLLNTMCPDVNELFFDEIKRRLEREAVILAMASEEDYHSNSYSDDFPWLTYTISRSAPIWIWNIFHIKRPMMNLTPQEYSNLFKYTPFFKEREYVCLVARAIRQLFVLGKNFQVNMLGPIDPDDNTLLVPHFSSPLEMESRKILEAFLDHRWRSGLELKSFEVSGKF